MIIYESDELEVTYTEGTTGTLCVIFGPLGGKPEGQAFWGQRLCQRAGSSAIGVFAKKPNWYIPADIDAAFLEVDQFLSKAEAVVTYGASMGGFAALKHSARVRASCAISFSPQVSIDPSIVGGWDKVFAKHFRKEIHSNMEPSPNDVVRNAYILFDPYNKPDRCSAELIQDHVPYINTIPTPWLGHEAIRAFSSTDLWRQIVKLGMESDFAALQKFANSTRRSSGHRRLMVAEAASVKRPSLGLQIFAASRDRINVREQAYFYNRFSLFRFREGKLDEAHLAAKKWLELTPSDPGAIAWLGKLEQALEARTAPNE